MVQANKRNFFGLGVGIFVGGSVVSGLVSIMDVDLIFSNATLAFFGMMLGGVLGERFIGFKSSR